MAKMEHTGDVRPSKEHQDKINEFITWLDKNGYKGLITLHGEKNVAVSWMNGDDNSIYADLICCVSAIVSYDAEAGKALIMALLRVASTINDAAKSGNSKQRDTHFVIKIKSPPHSAMTI